MASVLELRDRGKACHQAGDLPGAEQLYRRALESDASNAEVLYLLGETCRAQGKLAEAVTNLQQAVALKGDFAEAHNALGSALGQQGRFAEATASLRRALELKPRFAEAYYNLAAVAICQNHSAEAAVCWRHAVEIKPDWIDAWCNLATLALQENRLDESADCWRRAIALKPNFAEALNNLGTVLEKQGHLAEAAGCYRRACELKPDFALALVNLGVVRERQGKQAEAEDCWRRALTLKPDLAEAHNNLGTLLAKQERHAEAVASYQRALALRPDSVEWLCNLAGALSNLGQGDEAIATCRRALQLASDYAPAHYALASILDKQGCTDEAAAALRRALELNPRYAEAYNNLGVLLNSQGQHDEAIACCARALEINPQLAEAHHTLGRILAKQDNYDEAAECCRRALAINPGYDEVLVTYGVCSQFQSNLDEAIKAFRAAVRINPRNPNHLSNLIYALNYHPDYDAQSIAAEHREWGRRHADPLTAGAAPHANDRTPGRRLRIGYVSSHFCAHAVNFFSEPILAHHDHQAVEVFCYGAAPPSGADDTTRRLQGYADHWRDISHKNDRQAADMIRADQIDVLVDLAGHIGGNRLLVFAHKPVPVQVTYIGYQNTTGMAAMDYRLTDDWSDPPGATDRFYTERLVRLPRTFFCYLPSANAPPVSPLPAASAGHVTFGSFNNPSKITPQVLSTWAEILAAVPRSQLVILAPTGVTLQAHIERACARHGVDVARMALAHRRPRIEYLELIASVDIALDPFPFNGHTTTCDCLWMGVPVVMLAGETYASRFGGSALVNLGLRDLIASSRKQYVAIARDLAGDLDRLQTLRAGLRDTMRASPPLDFHAFTRQLEAAYRQMWTDWCAKNST